LSHYGKNPHTPDFCLRFSLLGIEASLPVSEDAARQSPPADFFNLGISIFQFSNELLFSLMLPFK